MYSLFSVLLALRAYTIATPPPPTPMTFDLVLPGLPSLRVYFKHTRSGDPHLSTTKKRIKVGIEGWWWDETIGPKITITSTSERTFLSAVDFFLLQVPTPQFVDSIPAKSDFGKRDHQDELTNPHLPNVTPYLRSASKNGTESTNRKS
jgi:hypothetical protein